MAVCMLGLGVYNQVIVDPDMRHRLDWVPLLLMLGYVVSRSVVQYRYFIVAGKPAQWKGGGFIAH